jgi:hypothetical protein
MRSRAYYTVIHLKQGICYYRRPMASEMKVPFFCQCYTKLALKLTMMSNRFIVCYTFLALHNLKNMLLKSGQYITKHRVCVCVFVNTNNNKSIPSITHITEQHLIFISWIFTLDAGLAVCTLPIISSDMRNHAQSEVQTAWMAYTRVKGKKR